MKINNLILFCINVFDFTNKKLSIPNRSCTLSKKFKIKIYRYSIQSIESRVRISGVGVCIVIIIVIVGGLQLLYKPGFIIFQMWTNPKVNQTSVDDIPRIYL